MTRETIAKIVKASGVSAGELILIHFWGENADKTVADQFAAAVAALGANLMHLKPCIAVKDGKMGVVKKYRGSFEHCMVQYTKELLEHSPNSRGDIAIVVHPAADRAAVDATLLTLKEDGRFKAVYEARTGCTVACHCGPNTIGVMFMTD